MGFPLGTLFRGFVEGYDAIDKIVTNSEDRAALKKREAVWTDIIDKAYGGGKGADAGVRQVRDALLTSPDATAAPGRGDWREVPPATTGSEASTRERVEKATGAATPGAATPGALPGPPSPKPPAPLIPPPAEDANQPGGLIPATPATPGVPAINPTVGSAAPPAAPSPLQSLTSARDTLGGIIGSYLRPSPSPTSPTAPGRSYTAPIVEGGPVTYDEVATPTVGELPPGSVPYQPPRAQPNPRGIWGTMQDIGGGVQAAGQAIGANLYERLPPRQIAVPPPRYPPGSMYGAAERVGQVPALGYNWIFGPR
jgi:hypothetical protein